MKLICPSQTHRNSIKYRLVAVPVHPHFALAFWMVHFLLDDAVKYVMATTSKTDMIEKVCTPLFDAVVDFIYVSKTPTVLKESAFYLLGYLIDKSKIFASNPFLGLPLGRLTKLKNEMLELYLVEKKR